MQYIIALILIGIAIWLIIKLIIWLLSLVPMIAGTIMTLFVGLMALALAFGVIRGLAQGFKEYYSTLTDVYGTRAGKIIGVVLTLVWIGVIVFLGRMAILGLIEQYQQLSQTVSQMS
ncbi:hypothetical protein BTIS_0244 [Bifidobacterium tissieri]|uniref:Uncharacterized protein n=1 Tax=Bifidobacterium tissieri TaxID=1630162 RepID=A0A261FIV6_9BIFI|nr:MULTISPECIES: hypothetical protein [Bifidobacterium]OZG59091.1 hypothetical protein BTIS_0244 [Bifidobacterium tissieri]TPF96346.1 hypothetical protein EP30_07925 [Bifidobacterium sp. UTCIF-39]